MLHPDPFRDIDRLAAQLLGTAPGLRCAVTVRMPPSTLTSTESGSTPGRSACSM